MHDFRFGFTLATPRSPRELRDICRTAEAYGYDVALAVDHLGPDRTSPFLGAVAAAYACEQLRVGTYVLNIGFWNPSVLARDVMSAVRLTGGRFELGLGTGVVKAQFDAAGIAWQPFQQRVDRLGATIDQLTELLAIEEDLTRPPLLLGGTGEHTLTLAAGKADIVSFGGRFQVAGQPPATLRIATAAETEQRVAFYESIAGERAEQERNCFVLDVEVTEDRRAAATRLAADYAPYTTVEQALESPFLLFGTEDEIAQQILQNRERFGFSYLSVQRPHMEVLGPIIKLVRSLA